MRINLDQVTQEIMYKIELINIGISTYQIA